MTVLECVRQLCIFGFLIVIGGATCCVCIRLTFVLVRKEPEAGEDEAAAGQEGAAAADAEVRR